MRTALISSCLALVLGLPIEDPSLSSVNMTTAETASDQVSTNGMCGQNAGGFKCPDPQCCSSSGFCGTGFGYCAIGCQTEFGACMSTSSPDGGNSANDNGFDYFPPANGGAGTLQCGPNYGNALCPGTLCCSNAGFCGNTEAFCGTDCNPEFGRCFSDSGASTSSNDTQNLPDVTIINPDMPLPTASAPWVDITPIGPSLPTPPPMPEVSLPPIDWNPPTIEIPEPTFSSDPDVPSETDISEPTFPSVPDMPVDGAETPMLPMPTQGMDMPIQDSSNEGGVIVSTRYYTTTFWQEYTYTTTLNAPLPTDPSLSL